MVATTNLSEWRPSYTSGDVWPSRPVESLRLAPSVAHSVRRRRSARRVSVSAGTCYRPHSWFPTPLSCSTNPAGPTAARADRRKLLATTAEADIGRDICINDKMRRRPTDKFCTYSTRRPVWIRKVSLHGQRVLIPFTKLRRRARPTVQPPCTR